MVVVGKMNVVVALVVVLVVAIGGGSSGALELCKMNEDGLMACKPSVTKPAPVDPPSTQCCEALSGADLACLCSYRNSIVLPSLGIDPELAMALPSKCNLTPPSTC